MSTSFRPRSKRRRTYRPAGLDRRLFEYAAQRAQPTINPLKAHGRRTSTIYFLSTGTSVDTPYDAQALAEDLLARQPGQVAALEVYGEGRTTKLAFIRAGAIAYIDTYVA